eukprot:76140-Rhodomonas_salina.1
MSVAKGQSLRMVGGHSLSTEQGLGAVDSVLLNLVRKGAGSGKGQEVEKGGGGGGGKARKNEEEGAR